MDITDEFVILTVADNQERKNLFAAMGVTCMLTHDITYEEFIDVCKEKRKISEFPRNDRKIKHVLVTRVETPFGFKIRDMALKLGINQEIVTMNRGMPNENLWSLYAMSDCFLLTSKAEGLGMILLEAMACGLVAIGTDTGAIHELLQDGRGFLIPSAHPFLDVWGNSLRDMFDIELGKDVVEGLIDVGNLLYPTNARAFMETKTWDKPAKQLSGIITQLTQEKKNG
jgi:glycosyltransferase involved in cell wall biosynthesis